MRRLNAPAVVRLLADIVHVYAFFLLLPTGVALLQQDRPQFWVFGAGSAVLLISSRTVRRLPTDDNPTTWHGTMALTFAWVLLSLVSSVPFVAHGMSWIDGLFEAFSAWTDTGLTMVVDPETLPLSLSVFRFMIQWFSGLGIVMFMLFLRAASPRGAHSLFRAEGRSETFSPDIWKIGRAVVGIYALYTVAGTIGLWLTGVPPFDALAHAITSLSTGGFSTNAVGVGIYGALPTIVAMVLMLAGGISFAGHRSLLSGRLGAFFGNPEVRWLFVIIPVMSALVLAQFWIAGAAFGTRVLESFFYVITAISTCGAGIPLALSEVPQGVVFSILLLMISGAVYGSTTGGLKLWRVIILAKIVRREVIRPFYPANAVLPLRVGDAVITDAQAARVAGYMMLYVLTGLVGGLVFTLFGYSVLGGLFTVFSAQGNVGLNALAAAAYYDMPAVLKAQLIVHMMLGRVEILPLLSLLHGLGE